ncbi:MAG: hypothetical protein ACE5K4_08025 [Candidatus Hydrothermarchaeota archaeon]
MESLIYTLFLLFSLPFAYYYLKTTIFPDHIGKIKRFEGYGKMKECEVTCDTSIQEISDGKMSIKVLVELSNGGEIRCEMSPCNICLEKMKEGDLVGVTKLGSRYIAQPLLLKRVYGRCQ